MCAVDLTRGSIIDDHDDVKDVHVGVLSFFLYRYSKGKPVCSVKLLQAYTANLEPRRAFTSLVFLCRNMQNTIIQRRKRAKLCIATLQGESPADLQSGYFSIASLNLYVKPSPMEGLIRKITAYAMGP